MPGERDDRGKVVSDRANVEKTNKQAKKYQIQITCTLSFRFIVNDS